MLSNLFQPGGLIGIIRIFESVLATTIWHDLGMEIAKKYLII
jgi:hypothetical protein